jgi:acetophenone carboxylase
MMAIADNTKLQTPQPLFGGYAPCTVPGISIRDAKLKEQFLKGENIDLNWQTLLTERAIEGNYRTQFQGRSVEPYSDGDVLTFAFSCGGTGYGDPLDRDLESVGTDMAKGIISRPVARQIYGAIWNERLGRIDISASEAERDRLHEQRRQRGKSWSDFQHSWNSKKPSAEILRYYGSWPEGRLEVPLLRA